jgi:single-stranded-DNA-specific exonuclease
VTPFQAFVRGLRKGRPVGVLCYSDAGGLAAGAILARALERAGHAVAAEVTGKGEGAWTPGVADRVARHKPQALVIADLGCRKEPVLPKVPTLFVDHHRPEGVPPGAALITGHGSDPSPPSGLLAYECGRLVADVSDLDWVAAVGLLHDIGEGAPFPLLAEARKRHKLPLLREATALLNAPRRSASADATPALELLLKAAGPQDVTKGDSVEAQLLREAREEVNKAFAQAKRSAPTVAGDVALVRVHSPCQVHPLVAQAWRSKLTQPVVLVGNTGYLPGQVHFSVRATSGVDLTEFLRSNPPTDAGPQYAHGDDHGTTGVMKVPEWNEFVTRLGFGPEATVEEESPEGDPADGPPPRAGRTEPRRRVSPPGSPPRGGSAPRR